MDKKESVDEKIKKVSVTCSKQLSELQKMLKKLEPESVDDNSMTAIDDALTELNKTLFDGSQNCTKAYQELEAKKKKPGEGAKEIAMGGGTNPLPDDRDLDLEDVL